MHTREIAGNRLNLSAQATTESRLSRNCSQVIDCLYAELPFWLGSQFAIIAP